jgi:hypothetical protein
MLGKEFPVGFMGQGHEPDFQGTLCFFVLHARLLVVSLSTYPDISSDFLWIGCRGCANVFMQMFSCHYLMVQYACQGISELLLFKTEKWTDFNRFKVEKWTL